MDIEGALELLEWKRRIFDLYSLVRSVEPQQGWGTWKATRDEMFRSHPQSPITSGHRAEFSGLDYFDYDPGLRMLGTVTPTDQESFDVGSSDGSSYSFTRLATVGFEINEREASLDAFWLEGYGGGLFMPFADATSGDATYGGGRYLYDTVKGADLGAEGDALVVDFNFAYQPSCSYDSRWSCPLAPPGNRLDLPIEAGERLTDY